MSNSLLVCCRNEWKATRQLKWAVEVASGRRWSVYSMAREMNIWPAMVLAALDFHAVMHGVG